MLFYQAIDIRRYDQESNLHFCVTMAQLPTYQPKQLSLGPLEAEILNIVWELEPVSVKDVHDRILADPERDLAYTSVTTVLRRLTNKGWLSCYKKGRIFYWKPMVSKEQAQAIKAYEQLHRFLAIGNADVVASFADSLDTASVEQLKAIASRLDTLRQQRRES
ncbi:MULTISPECIES: BlaI/MecI/CopY family transcriptional regulator [Microcystis]|uniref:Transcriptional repressor n=3 Tax=Microcystis TaxID=1125 RepID=I4FR82_MICAE|nr:MULTISPECIES: BlaI/MecI/CopY family transcriptional regulator [Microcystis]MCE2662932.1 BlaI/MecI/CopY family transcriptional regulator [Microcystis sp. 53602_E8]MCZ8306785.1 BlaI/MecI/CopY family transcriptional regulator [Microcystis sp. LE19-98.1E]MCZ8362804.1 BlaI/MecI/CopY family transcriptional regulator [Microcystis sp. LE19-251.1A]AKV67595.1 Transcriptional regulator MecI [Microcystis panniformis FACHB-1757]MCZ8027655.1 BlaI/MecI/CopY family transcriptional regulator [Microcystis sp